MKLKFVMMLAVVGMVMASCSSSRTDSGAMDSSAVDSIKRDSMMLDTMNTVPDTTKVPDTTGVQ